MNHSIDDLLSNLGVPSLEEILALTRTIGWGAAEILQSYYHKDSSQGRAELAIQGSADAPTTAADLAANHYILDNLQSALGQKNFAYLSEETFSESDHDRLGYDWVWIIDPLDGTRDFIDRTGEFAVHIALVYQERPVLAVVSWPEAHKLYYATLGGGSFVETRDPAGQYYSQPVRVSNRFRLEELSLVASRSHRDDRLNRILQEIPFQDQRFVGSVGCKIATIVEQQADVYMALSGKSAPKDWDYAAPELILTEAGGQLTHFDGTSLRYNQMDVRQWGGLLASNGHSHAELCQRAETVLLKIERLATEVIE